jgi:hypothetical protein
MKTTLKGCRLARRQAQPREPVEGRRKETSPSRGAEGSAAFCEGSMKEKHHTKQSKPDEEIEKPPAKT